MWEDPESMVSIPNPEGGYNTVPMRREIIELTCDKNKITRYKGRMFFKLRSESGRLEEVAESDQRGYLTTALQYEKHGRGGRGRDGDGIGRALAVSTAEYKDF